MPGCSTAACGCGSGSCWSPASPTTPDEIEEVARIAEGMAEIIERVEVLPYHRLGVEKYTALGREYPLGDTPSPTLESVEQAVAIFRAHGLVRAGLRDGPSSRLMFRQ